MLGALAEGRPPKVGMISLGCAKNLVDAEIMLGSARARGFEITSDASQADVLVVNTCGFIGRAKQESIDAILSARQRPEQKLIVSGCLAQRYQRELARELPEVDAFIGLTKSPAGEIFRRVLTAGSTRSSRSSSFLSGRATCRTSTRHDSGLLPATLPTSRLPRDAIILAAFVSSRRCVGATGAAQLTRSLPKCATSSPRE